MKVEIHLESLREGVGEIEESIKKGIIDKQRTLGFHTSAGAMDMLEIILHKNNLIDPGFTVKHDWFLSKKKIDKKFPFEFQNKKEILDAVVAIENVRNSLCYGKRKKEKELEQLIKDFNKLKHLFVEATGYEL
ncbi:hypothetical protein HYV89_01045 [Candidatus Woesearchaeota archaeon]|nr:hypothetical protein [Candidatus Woesearchaeota archaeon]